MKRAENLDTALCPLTIGCWTTRNNYLLTSNKYEEAKEIYHKQSNTARIARTTGYSLRANKISYNNAMYVCKTEIVNRNIKEILKNECK